MATAPSTLSLPDDLCWRTSCLSDCGSPKRTSGLVASCPVVWLEPLLPISRQSVPPGLALAPGPPHPPPLTGQALRPPTPSSSSPVAAASRPLCLDFLNGKCRRQMGCRYHHPHPGEGTLPVTPSASPNPLSPNPAVAGTVHDPLRPVCEVWALTGFCKYGPRCWRRHPRLAAPLDASIDKPITNKFQQWLQSRSRKPLAPGSARFGEPAATAGRPDSPREAETSPRSTAPSEQSDRSASDGLLLAVERLRGLTAERGEAAPQSPPQAEWPAAGPAVTVGPRPVTLWVGRFPPTAGAGHAEAALQPRFVHQPYAL